MFKKLIREAQFCGSKRLLDKHDRRIWLPIMLVLLCCAATVVVKMINRFLDSPTYIIQQEYVQEKMPFPSVLVCPELTFPDHRIDRFFKDIDLPSDLNESYVRSTIQQLASFYSPDVNYTVEDLTNLEKILNMNNIDVRTATENLTASCEETLIRCSYSGYFVNCSEIFFMELTSSGYCCTFNGRILKTLRHEQRRVEEKVTMLDSTNAIFKSAFWVAVNQSQPQLDIDLSYKWVVVEGGGSYAIASNNGTPLSRGAEHWFAYSSIGSRIGEQAKFLNEELRRCRMSQEKLTYFPIYNDLKYCLLECEAARTLENCDCVLHTQPHKPSARHCNATDLPCVKHSTVTISTYSNECGCPPSCDADVDILKVQSIVLDSDSMPFEAFYEGLDFDNISIVKVFIAKPIMRIYTMTSYFYIEQIYGQLGGVFNLFFGCSILTIFEIFQILYYAVKERFSAKLQRKKRDLKQLRIKQNKMKAKLRQIQNEMKLEKRREVVEKGKISRGLDMKRKSLAK